MNVEFKNSIFGTFTFTLPLEDVMKKITSHLTGIVNALTKMEGSSIGVKLDKLSEFKTELDELNIFVGKNRQELEFFFPKELQDIEETLNNTKITCAQLLCSYRIKLEQYVAQITLDLISKEKILSDLELKNHYIVMQITDQINELTDLKRNLSSKNIFIAMYSKYLPNDVYSLKYRLTKAMENCNQHLETYQRRQSQYEWLSSLSGYLK